jgi:hypothetical protein
MAISRLSIAQSATRRSGNPRLAIYTENQAIVFTSKFAPREVEYSGYEASWNEIMRPDRKPLITRSGSNLRKISMELFVGSTDPDESVDSDLKTLENLADTRIPILLEYDPRTYGKWIISSLSFSSIDRRTDTDEITRSNVSIEFTEIATKTKGSLNPFSKTRPKSVKTKSKTSLFKIAKKYYGTSNIQIVKAIAKYNNIKNLRHIPKGKRIRLP